MPKYRKKPVVVEAVKWTGENRDEITSFTKGRAQGNLSPLTISTLEGEMRVSVGDYIIRGVREELYPCKPDIFEQTYEVVEEENADRA